MAPALVQFMDAQSVMHKMKPLDSAPPCYQQNPLIIFGATSPVTFTVSARRPGVRLPGMRRASVVNRKGAHSCSVGFTHSDLSESKSDGNADDLPPAPGPMMPHTAHHMCHVRWQAGGGGG